MIAEVIRGFIDKHTGEPHNVGDIIEITEDRFKEILAVGEFVKEVVEVEEEEVDLKSLKKDELVKMAEDMGLDTTGTKADIIERITAEEGEE